MSNQELKTCPFCGGAAVKGYNSGAVTHIYCMDCRAMTHYQCSEQDALDAWNTRAPQPQSDMGLENEIRKAWLKGKQGIDAPYERTIGDWYYLANRITEQRKELNRLNEQVAYLSAPQPQSGDRAKALAVGEKIKLYDCEWQIEGIHLGAEGQESLVQLKSLTHKPGWTGEWEHHPMVFVPEPIIRAALTASQTCDPDRAKALAALDRLEKTFHSLMTRPSRPEIFGIPSIQFSEIRVALTQPEFEVVDVKDQNMAVWQAMRNIIVGNKTDDKLIVAELHKMGYQIVRKKGGER